MTNEQRQTLLATLYKSAGMQMDNLLKPDADPRTIAEAMRQTGELVLAELKEGDEPK